MTIEAEITDAKILSRPGLYDPNEPEDESLPEITDDEILARPRMYDPNEPEDESLPEITDDEILAEGNLSDSTPQNRLMRYLQEVLAYLYRAEGWFISADLAIIHGKRRYLSPDVAVFKGVVVPEAEQDVQKSYRLNPPDRPAPGVVFEISSDATWDEDLDKKPVRYGQIGVKEYFAYDPNKPQLWKDKSTRLKGWRYDQNGQAQEIVSNAQGWLWSQELESWLKPDLAYLRLLDRNLQQHLTLAEAERVAKDAAQTQVEVERAARDAAQTQVEVERAEKEAILEKLRRAGIDLDKL